MLCNIITDVNFFCNKRHYVFLREQPIEIFFFKSADTDNLQNRYADYRHFADNLPIGKISADIEAYLPIIILSADKMIFCRYAKNNEKYGHKQMIAD